MNVSIFSHFMILCFMFIIPFNALICLYNCSHPRDLQKETSDHSPLAGEEYTAASRGGGNESTSIK